MSAEPQLKFEIQTAAELAEYLRSAVSWGEIEALTRDFSHWKVEAWKLLSDGDKDRVLMLKRWKDHPVAKKFPPGCSVQRIKGTTGLVGTVLNYWSAYGIDYITFQVGPDVDWCRASFLKRAIDNN